MLRGIIKIDHSSDKDASRHCLLPHFQQYLLLTIRWFGHCTNFGLIRISHVHWRIGRNL